MQPFKMPSLFLVASLFICLPGGVKGLAQVENDANEANSESLKPNANYEMEVLKDGSIARMNTQTGKMSLCVVNDGKMICRLAVDERDAYEDEIDRLSSKLAQSGQGNAGSKDATEGDESSLKFNRALQFSQEAMRRFYGVIQELRKEYPELQSQDEKSGEGQ